MIMFQIWRGFYKMNKIEKISETSVTIDGKTYTRVISKKEALKAAIMSDLKYSPSRNGVDLVQIVDNGLEIKLPYANREWTFDVWKAVMKNCTEDSGAYPEFNSGISYNKLFICMDDM